MTLTKIIHSSQEHRMLSEMNFHCVNEIHGTSENFGQICYMKTTKLMRKEILIIAQIS